MLRFASKSVLILSAIGLLAVYSSGEENTPSSAEAKLIAADFSSGHKEKTNSAYSKICSNFEKREPFESVESTFEHFADPIQSIGFVDVENAEVSEDGPLLTFRAEIPASAVFGSRSLPERLLDTEISKAFLERGLS